MNILPKIAICTLTFLFILLPFESFSQEDRVFKKIWFEMVFKSSSHESFIKGIESIEATKWARGIKNAYPFSQALIMLAKDDIQKGAYMDARIKAQASSSLSPDYALPYIFMAKIDLIGKGNGFFSAVENLWKAVKVSLKSFPVFMSIIGNSLYYITLIILFVYGLFMIGVVVRVMTPLNHDIGHLLPYYFSEKVKWTFTVFVLIIPIILGIGILWLCFLYTAIFWFYLRRNEKFFAFVFVIFMIFAPIGISLYSTAVFSLKNPHFLHLIKVNEGFASDEDKKILVEWANNMGEIPEVFFTLGMLEKREDQLDEAIRYYKMAIDRDPSLAQAYNNLGNALFLRGKINEAVEAYKKALELNPESLASHYNLSQLLAMQYRFDESGEELERAVSIDPSKIFRIQTLSTLYGDRILIDETMDIKRYWAVAQRQFPEKALIREGIYRKLYGFGNIPSYPGYVFLILMMMIMVEIISQRVSFSIRCINCGGPVCFRCRRKKGEERLCHECTRLITYGERIDPDIKVLKSLQIKRFHRRERYIALFSSILIPGLGMIIKGKVGHGLLMVFLTFTIFILLFIKPPLHVPWILPVKEFSIGVYILIALFLIAYIANVRYVLKRLILWV